MDRLNAWLVRFPGIPEALTEGKTEEEARANAVDCVIAALEGYLKASKALPRQGASQTGRDRAVLPSLVTAKVAVYETMRTRGWSKLKLAKMLGMSENSVRRLLDLRHGSHMWIIDEALSKMNAALGTRLLLRSTLTRRRSAALPVQKLRSLMNSRTQAAIGSASIMLSIAALRLAA